jgi:hypothetical protein
MIDEPMTPRDMIAFALRFSRIKASLIRIGVDLRFRRGEWMLSGDTRGIHPALSCCNMRWDSSRKCWHGDAEFAVLGGAILREKAAHRHRDQGWSDR